MAERIRADSAHIIPSAYCTGYVWYRHQLADPAFATAFGRWVHGCVASINLGARIGFGLNIEDFPLQHHLLIDARLTRGGGPLHYRGAAEIEQAFTGCGFGWASLPDPQVDGVGLGSPKGRMPSLVRVIEARV